MRIFVNGAAVEVAEQEVSYELVRLIAYDGQDDRHPSITYRGAAPPKVDGILYHGETVRIAEGTVFNAFETGNA